MGTGHLARGAEEEAGENAKREIIRKVFNVGTKLFKATNSKMLRDYGNMDN